MADIDGRNRTIPSKPLWMEVDGGRGNPCLIAFPNLLYVRRERTNEEGTTRLSVRVSVSAGLRRSFAVLLSPSARAQSSPIAVVSSIDPMTDRNGEFS
jgi:hypothetical protein